MRKTERRPETRIVAFNVGVELYGKIETLAAARGCSPQEVMQEALRVALPLDDVMEGVLLQVQAVSGRTRASVISAILIRHFAESLARVAVHPEGAMVLDFAAMKNGIPLEGGELYTFLFDRYCRFLRGQAMGQEAGIQFAVVAQAGKAAVQLAPQPAAAERAEAGLPAEGRRS